MLTKGMQGKFRFLEPLDTKFDNDMIYTVTSITSIQELMNSFGLDFTAIYDNYMLSEHLEKDIEDNVDIVGLQPKGGIEYFYVPLKYIASKPTNNGIKYVEKLLVMNLGLVPVDIDLENLKDGIKNMIQSKVGLENIEIKDLDNSAIVEVEEDEHQSYMSRTNAFLSKEETLQARYDKLLIENDELHKKVAIINQAVIKFL